VTVPRLNAATVDRLAPTVTRPGYAPADQGVGLVHLGIGAFHRAHQAVYTDDAMSAGDRDWRTLGVSLRSGAVRDEIEPQDGLYTVTERSGAVERTRLIGSVAGVVVAPESPGAVIEALAAPSTLVVSLTVTEKGYGRGPDGALDANLADIAADLRAEGLPRTLYGFLAEAVSRRRAAGAPGLTVMSCDNLAHNGAQLRGLFAEFLEHRSAHDAAWVAAHCAFPSTMVDRIVPAPTPEDRTRLARDIGLYDAAAVVTEPFRQWVIEDWFAGPRPRWEVGGAELVADVAAYETAKLRMLNGAHSAFAYLGLLAGHAFVHEAIADPAIRSVVERLMRDEAAASLSPAPGQNLAAYADALIARFENTALAHRLVQIAMDGSQKIPQRWLQTLADRRARGADCPSILRALAAWTLVVRGDRIAVVDPAADELATLWRSVSSRGIIPALFGPEGRFADTWIATETDQSILQAAVFDLDS